MSEFIVQDRSGRRQVAIGRQMSIGRGSSNDLVLNAQFASRRHAQVWQQGDRVIIEDLTSTNGTFVNGQRLERPRFLNHNDVVMIGDGHLTFVAAHDRASDLTPPQGVLQVMASQVACPSCGMLNHPQAQVCARCGHPLPPRGSQDRPRTIRSLTPTDPVLARPFPAPTVVTPPGRQSRSGVWILILLLGILAVAFLTALAILVLYVVS